MSALAEALLVRHLQESWPFGDEGVPSWFQDPGAPPRYHDQIRTVAVVGAGASLPVRDIATELAEDLEKDLEKDDNAREVELDRLETVYGLDRESFETRLTALCRTPEAERQVREAISKEYRLRHPSLLTYETLAHLLNHRYLDLIISFNFDELLDQSIDDELGRDEYTRVVSEGDFDLNSGVTGPLYVKMHGSATEPDSLRFTRERYYWTPKSIIELVESKFDVDNLVLITLGFKMDSFDFQHLLRKPKNLEIYHLDPSELSGKVLGQITEQRKKARERKETDRSADTDEPSRVASFAVARGQPGTDFLEKLVGQLVVDLEKLCKSPTAGPAKWRSTLRHQAVVKLIDGTDLKDKQRHARYLRRRTILEIALTVAKGRGVVSITSMVGDRCGRYYDLYRQVAGDKADDWLSLCKAGGLVESMAYPDTYEVLPEVRRNVDTSGSNSYDIHKFHLADPKKLANHAANSLGFSKGRKTESIELLTKTLEYLQHDTEIEIHSCDDRVCSKLFAKPMQLKTLTALRGWTCELLLNTPDFDELWYVAETGDWILEPPIRELLAKRCNKIQLLQAFDANVDIRGVEIETHKLPWGRHNRHMTIVRSNNESRAAIYFVRRLRAPSVSPVYLAGGAEDLRRVTLAFQKLWFEAQSYEKERSALADS
jgi:SIR2-like domain